MDESLLCAGQKTTFLSLEALVGGTYMDRSLGDFMRACGVRIEEEQKKLLPETHLIALLCDAIRLGREMMLCAQGNSTHECRQL